MSLLLVLELRAQELCGSRGGRPELPAPIKSRGFCGHKAALNQVLQVSRFGLTVRH